ncbi:MAG: exosortase/archaeosortase family protein [Candidatus Bathyarchaeota archaeon]|jgi:thaumarchaeosortase|nr:exosortase/archaeosortase family protein [Candidatus Bathyarchaeota archaeon]
MASIIQNIKNKLLNLTQTLKKNIGILTSILLILAFIIPFFILYSLYPQSYEVTWKGRTYYLFFAWLIFIELVLGWEKIRVNKLNKLKSIRNIAFIILLLLPTAYVVTANYYGLNTAIVDFAVKNNIPRAHEIPLSTEYLVFTIIFVLTLLLAYGREGLAIHSISAIFLGIIGLIYAVDCLYPYGAFTPFQILVPTTATLAAIVLNLMGYQVEWEEPFLGTPVLKVWNQNGEAKAGIAWSCSGIDSLLIYSVTILLFLKDSGIPWRQRTIYFIIGAAITYFINVLRIVTIFIIGIDYGVGSPQWWRFHNYYGSLYSIVWIVIYPLLIMGTQILWRKIKSKGDSKNDIRFN